MPPCTTLIEVEQLKKQAEIGRSCLFDLGFRSRILELFGTLPTGFSLDRELLAGITVGLIALKTLSGLIFSAAFPSQDVVQSSPQQLD